MNAQPNLETRFDRGAWLTLAVAIAWILYPLSASLLTMQFPSDGWGTIRAGFDGTYRVSAHLADAPSPLQIDDVIVAVNGQALTAKDPPPLPPNVQEGQSVQYTVQRDGLRLDVEVTLLKVGAAGYVRGLFSRLQASPRDFIVATLSFLIVTFAFFLRPRNLGARYLMAIFSFYFAVNWFGFGLSEMYAFTWPPLLPFLTSFIGSSWGWYFFPSLTLMPLAFPVVKAPLRRFPRLLPALLYGIPFILSAIGNGLVIATRDFGWTGLLLPVFIILVGLTVISIFGSLIHNWLTIREPVARAQLRWVTLGLGGGLGIPFAVMFTLVFAFNNFAGVAADMLWLMLLLPISLAIAILRYRLFDIDLIIRRTLQYSLLSGLLALTYFGLVIVLQSTFATLTGQNQSPLVTVLSTLAIAALSLPLRRRVQDFIDRRFYRKKYDAQRVLAEFAATARDETDIEKLTARLVEVVEETMQPESVTLWLKPMMDGRRTTAVETVERKP
ncbi:MAG TPA: hypothetical protein VJ020_08335 [Anaerolineales bacterium]|nr:hypothetical protein [Anaerolineales bacterium]